MGRCGHPSVRLHVGDRPEDGGPTSWPTHRAGAAAAAGIREGLTVVGAGAPRARQVRPRCSSTTWPVAPSSTPPPTASSKEEEAHRCPHPMRTCRSSSCKSLVSPLHRPSAREAGPCVQPAAPPSLPTSRDGISLVLAHLPDCLPAHCLLPSRLRYVEHAAQVLRVAREERKRKAAAGQAGGASAASSSASQVGG